MKQDSQLNSTVTTKPIYFIRHNFNAIEESAKTLHQNRYIAFHFIDEFYEQKEEYSIFNPHRSNGFSRAHDAFDQIAKNGAIVVFEYHDTDKFYIATVSPGQRIRPFPFKTSVKKEILYKVLEYKDARTFSYSEHPVLLALRPPYSTICQPGEHFQRIIRHLYLGQVIPCSVNLLHPKMLEQLCENYLRSEFAPTQVRLRYTFMKTGKTLPFLDIVGRSAIGQKLLIQVTHHRGIPARKKAQLLVAIQQAEQNAISIMFSADSAVDVPALTYHFNINNIFNVFARSPTPWHNQMLNDMLGIDINPSSTDPQLGLQS